MHNVEASELRDNLVGRSANEQTQAALTFAQRVVELRGHVSNADLSAVRAAGYTDADILDIIAVVTLNIFTNYVNNVAETEIDFPVARTASLNTTAV
jgi:alkylhydroperoxidase family enzyme